MNNRIIRFLVGLGIVLVIVTAIFVLFAALIPTWGATTEEVRSVQPGDELVTQPNVYWDHAITINAPVDQVWPWLIQMGDTRAAYYSYTFIENAFVQAANSKEVYVNADRVHPEWQNPTKGQGMIADMLVLNDYKPGAYVLAVSTDKVPAGMYWTWLWAIRSVDQGHTRLLVRHRIQFPGEINDVPLMKHLVTLTGFVMERSMMEGIRERAESTREPAFIETVEIALWLFAFACGVIGAVLYMRRSAWQMPLIFGLLCILILFIFTYVQPPIWTRILVDIILAAGILYQFKMKTQKA